MRCSVPSGFVENVPLDQMVFAAWSRIIFSVCRTNCGISSESLSKAGLVTLKDSVSASFLNTVSQENLRIRFCIFLDGWCHNNLT